MAKHSGWTWDEGSRRLSMYIKGTGVLTFTDTYAYAEYRCDYGLFDVTEPATEPRKPKSLTPPTDASLHEDRIAQDDPRTGETG